MANGASETEEHEMIDVATQQPDNRREGNVRRAPTDHFMTTVKAHITKLLSVLFLMLLGLAVVTLQKQLHLSSSYQQGYQTNQQDIAGLQQAYSEVPQLLQYQMSAIAADWAIDPPPAVDRVYEQVNALNMSLIIRDEWIRAGDLYFHKFTQHVTYQEASQYCIQWTGELAVKALTSPSAVKYLSDSTSPAWVGYKRINGTWNWTQGDGTNGTQLFINEITTTHSASQMDCGFIQGSNDTKLHLQSALCNQTMSYVCEVDMNYAY